MSVLGIDDHKKFVYNEMPDFGLSVLKNRFQTKNLETQYKRYEQRILISKYYAARDWKKLYFFPPGPIDRSWDFFGESTNVLSYRKNLR